MPLSASSKLVCALARSDLLFDVLDECSQLGQDLTLAWMVEKNSRCCDGEARQQRLQSRVGDRRLGERGGHLRESQTLDRRAEKGRVVVRDERPVDDGVDRLVAVDKGPGRDRSVRAAQAQAGVV